MVLSSAAMLGSAEELLGDVGKDCGAAEGDAVLPKKEQEPGESVSFLFSHHCQDLLRIIHSAVGA